jgi:hypothetical protein
MIKKSFLIKSLVLNVIYTLQKPIMRKWLIISIAIGVGSIFYKTVISPSPPTDFEVYYYSAKNAYSGDMFVGESAVDRMQSKRSYNYLPITVVLFYPLIIFSSELAYIILLFSQIVAGIFILIVVIRIIKYRGVEIHEIDSILVAGLIFLSMVASMNLRMGQINHMVLALLIIGYWSIVTERSQSLAGFCFAVAALFKLWPAIFGIWLITQRAYRATIVALSVGVGGIIVSIGVFGIEIHRIYFNWLVNVRSRTGAFAGGIPPDRGLLTIRRAISAAVPSLDPSIMAIIAVVIIGPPVMYIILTRNNDPLNVFTGILVGFILVFPSIQHYMIYPLIPIIILGYTTSSNTYERWLGVSAVAVSWIGTPDNILSVVGAVAPTKVFHVTKNFLNTIFLVIHPATFGLIIVLILVIHRSSK